MSFPKICLLFTILVISIVRNCLHLTDVIIMHLTPQLAAYSGLEYFEALVEEVIDAVVMEYVNDAYGEEEVEDL